jgi:trypsin
LSGVASDQSDPAFFSHIAKHSAYVQITPTGLGFSSDLIMQLRSIMPSKPTHKSRDTSPTTILFAVKMKLQTVTQATIVASNSILLAAAAGSIRGRALGLFDGSNRIIGGDRAVEDRYPYAVSLSDDIGHFCGGSLIARDVVLTAAHCDEGGEGKYKAVVGRHALADSDGQELSVKQALPHPNYDAGATDNDFLLIFLKEAASTDINLVKLNSDADTPNVGAAVTVMGWGDIDPTDDGQVLASELMEVEVNVISNEECDNSDGSSGSYKDSITSNMLCAKEEGGGEDSCQGDSGGPLILKGANASKDVQVGVVSWGIGCASKDYPGVYARVSAQHEWIRSEVCAKSSFAPSEFDCSNAAPPSNTTPSSSPNDSGGVDDGSNWPTFQPTKSPSWR